jgi:hypothetical protein
MGKINVIKVKIYIRKGKGIITNTLINSMQRSINIFLKKMANDLAFVEYLFCLTIKKMAIVPKG